MQFSLEKSSFNEAKPHLLPAMGADADFLERQVASGEAECWKVSGKYYMLLRLEELADNSKELVLVAVSGKSIFCLNQILLRLAKAVRADHIRFHACGSEKKVKALGRYYRRFLKQHKPQLVEAVYKIKV